MPTLKLPPVAILLGGVMAKLGTYGLVRFGLGLFPETWALVARLGNFGGNWCRVWSTDSDP